MSGTGELRVTVSLQGRFHGYDLARELDRLGHLQCLITSQPRSRVTRWGIPRRRIRSILRYETLRQAAARLRVQHRIPHFNYLTNEAFDRAAARKLEPSDVVVAWSATALHTLRRARGLGARTVVERGSAHIAVQKAILEEEYERWSVGPTDRVDPWAVEKGIREYEEADAIAVPSQFVYSTFVAQGVSTSKLIVVPYGVDVAQFRPSPRIGVGFRALFVGALTLRKGVPYALEAAQKAGVELWLVGRESPETAALLERYRGSFTPHGAVPQAELPRFYAQADVLIVPSVEDGFAMVVLQALACGIPVICSTNAGGADFIQEGRNGFVVPVRDAEAIAARLLELRRNPDQLSEMKQGARLSILERDCGWAAYARTLVGHYRRLVTGDAQQAGSQGISAAGACPGEKPGPMA